MQARTVVVISGAVARGAYEAAAMATLLPRILDDLRSTVFVGTSAGAINAALWARFATPGRSVAEVGERVLEVWRSIDDTAVFGPLATSVGGTLIRSASNLLTRRGRSHLLDARPLRETVARELHPSAIAENIAKGALLGVGVAATFCGSHAASGRSHLFFHGSIPLPSAHHESGIDYVAAQLTPAHILASSAVPVLFEPVSLQGPDGESWYIDGGVRLNTPIYPAIALGAERVVVISSHSARYPDRGRSRKPSVNDTVAQILHSVAADSMIEDLRELKRRNHEVRTQSESSPPSSPRGRPYRLVPHLVVAPQPGELAARARASLEGASWLSPRALRYRMLDGYLAAGGAGPGQDEILSYLLFDPSYFASQFELGQRHAERAAEGGFQL